MECASEEKFITIYQIDTLSTPLLFHKENNMKEKT